LTANLDHIHGFAPAERENFVGELGIRAGLLPGSIDRPYDKRESTEGIRRHTKECCGVPARLEWGLLQRLQARRRRAFREVSGDRTASVTASPLETGPMRDFLVLAAPQ
jgi:hypothetical protein